jgi:hypothetical protein
MLGPYAPMRRLALILLAFVPIWPASLVPANAAADPEQQRRAIGHVAALAFANTWCSDYKVDTDKATALLNYLDSDPSKEPFKSQFDAERLNIEKKMGEIGATKMCAVLYETFKPGGQLGTQFMIRR